MSAYTSNVNLRALLWANNTVTINNLEAELQHQFSCGWKLNDWDFPVCDDEDEECSICSGYTSHFLSRLSRADDDSTDDDSADEARGGKGGSSSMEDEEGRKGSPTQGSDSESEEVQEKSVAMKKLLRLRDLRARERAYKSDEPENLQGMIVTLTFEKLRAEADRDAANSSWSVAEKEKDTLQKSLQTLTQAHDELQTHHKAALDEIEVLKQRLSVAVSAAVPAIPTFSHPEWLAMKMPTPSSSPQLLACWLQFQEHTSLKGVHVCDPRWDVDLRDLRGYREVMSRVPELRKNSGCNERQHHQLCIFAILEVLAVPGQYAELLHAHQYPVATEVQYYPLSLQEGHSNLVVTRLLAAQGLTVAVADDTWQYSYRYIKAVAEDQKMQKARTDAAQRLLGHIEERLRDSPPPVGLKPVEADCFRRPINLPNKRL
ncbi:hypothetical protein K438DRAFT_1978145 [Mycena galopus ATCC 62051]|nr:hypothetical protein K438DRAFT_1978145 [Mycena galopus ATCC 62051]